MKNRQVLIGVLTVVLVFGLVLVTGCPMDGDTSTEKDSTTGENSSSGEGSSTGEGSSAGEGLSTKEFKGRWKYTDLEEEYGQIYMVVSDNTLEFELTGLATEFGPTYSSTFTYTETEITFTTSSKRWTQNYIFSGNQLRFEQAAITEDPEDTYMVGNFTKQ